MNNIGPNAAPNTPRGPVEHTYQVTPEMVKVWMISTTKFRCKKQKGAYCGLTGHIKGHKARLPMFLPPKEAYIHTHPECRSLATKFSHNSSARVLKW